MMKRRHQPGVVYFVFCILLLSLWTGPGLSVAAQGTGGSVIDWLPADYAGFVRLNLEQGAVFRALNMSASGISALQPGRLAGAGLFAQLLPLDVLDVPDATFEGDIFPWLADELVVAYPAADTQPVMILPARDALAAAAYMGRIIRVQDLLEEVEYNGQAVFLGDKIAFAITPTAVVIGAEAQLYQILDVAGGQAPALIDTDVYRAVADAMPAGALVSGYTQGAHVLPIFSALLSGSTETVPLWEIAGAALATPDGSAPDFATLLLSGDAQGAGFILEADTVRASSLVVRAYIHMADATAAPHMAAFNPDVMAFIPQHAMLVHTGDNLQQMVDRVLQVWPLAGVSGDFLWAFPFTLPASPEAVTLREVQQRTADMTNLLANAPLTWLTSVDGAYTLALLPRPNDPLPQLNWPFDVLLVTESSTAQTAAQQVAEWLRLVFGMRLGRVSVGRYDFQGLAMGQTSDPVLYIGVVDDFLLLSTSRTTLEQALAARRGDNQLKQRDAWRNVAGDTWPQLYADIPLLYGVLAPAAVMSDRASVRQAAISVNAMADNLFEVVLRVRQPPLF